MKEIDSSEELAQSLHSLDPMHEAIVGSHLSKHAGTKGCSDTENIQTILFVYKAGLDK